MGGRNDPVQSVRRRHVDAAIEQPMHEARVLGRIDVPAVVAVIENRVAAGEINLKHRAKSLHDGINLPPPKPFAESGDSRIANLMDLLVDRAFIRGQQIQICRNHTHSEPVAIESAVVQYHVSAPAHAVENHTLSSDGAYWEAYPQSLAKGAEVGLQSVILLV